MFAHQLCIQVFLIIYSSFVNSRATFALDDYANIKNQISKQYFTEMDPTRLKMIMDGLGCKSIDCPALMAACNIEYNILETVAREYVGRGEKMQKIIVQSTDTEIINNGPTIQNVTTIGYTMKCIQEFEVTITKTTQIRSEKEVRVLFFKKKKTHTFTHTEVERIGEINETEIYFPSQNVTVAPFSKMKVTFNFYQYDDINNYFLDFEIAKNSTFMYPDIDANANVVFLKKPLGDFLVNHIEFMSTLKYDSQQMLKLEAKDEKFILRNLPTTEKVTNHGVDVSFEQLDNL